MDANYGITGYGVSRPGIQKLLNFENLTNGEPHYVACKNQKSMSLSGKNWKKSEKFQKPKSCRQSP